MPQSLSQAETNIKIPRISQIYNIRYEEDGMRFWKAYGVCKGGWLASDQTQSVHIPILQVLEPFSSECHDTGEMATT